MKAAITIVDKNLGLTLNNRPLSRDKKLYEYIDQKIKNDTNNQYILIENDTINNVINDIDLLYLFNWNRKYPHDTKLQINFDEFKLIAKDEFKGNSHDKISLMVYKRK